MIDGANKLIRKMIKKDYDEERDTEIYNNAAI